MVDVAIGTRLNLPHNLLGIVVAIDEDTVVVALEPDYTNNAIHPLHILYPADHPFSIYKDN